MSKVGKCKWEDDQDQKVRNGHKLESKSESDSKDADDGEGNDQG